MTRVIEGEGDAGNEPTFVFSVYLSPKDQKTVLGYLRPYAFSEGKNITYVKTDFGLDALTTLREAVSLAEQYGVPFLLVQDPARIFPSEARLR